jgi:hypothetical protein
MANEGEPPDGLLGSKSALIQGNHNKGRVNFEVWWFSLFPPRYIRPLTLLHGFIPRPDRLWTSEKNAGRKYRTGYSGRRLKNRVIHGKPGQVAVIR